MLQATCNAVQHAKTQSHCLTFFQLNHFFSLFPLRLYLSFFVFVFVFFDRIGIWGCRKMSGAGGGPTAAVANACRSRLISSVERLWKTEWGLPKDSAQVGLILSGGVDTCAVLESLLSLGLRPSIAFTVFASPDATDRPYASGLAKQCPWMEHVVLECSPTELLEAPLGLCVKSLGTFDGMELRNSIVVARAIMEAQRRGVKI